MKITIIGMSNVGKTYWSRKLEEAGFYRFSCDDYIEKRLDKELKESGYAGISDMAKWMGQPYEAHYPQTSRKYLEFETESLTFIINQIKYNKISNKNIVIDTTGSTIYAAFDVLNELADITNIVYLDTPKSIQKEMCRLYFQNSKPVIWGNSFQINGESSLHKALKKCYPQLLEYRTKHYKKLAKLSLDYHLLRSKDFAIVDFLNKLQGKDEKLVKPNNYDFI